MPWKEIGLEFFLSFQVDSLMYFPADIQLAEPVRSCTLGSPVTVLRFGFEL